MKEKKKKEIESSKNTFSYMDLQAPNMNKKRKKKVKLYGRYYLGFRFIF